MGYKVEKEPEINIWPLKVNGLVKNPISFTYEEITSMPKKEIDAEIVCLEGKTLTGKWEGVLISEVISDVEPLGQAKYLTVTSFGGFKETIELSKADEIYLAYNYEDNPIDKEHGGPYRILAPEKYAYKNVKWVKEIKFVAELELGYWEKKGYPEGDEPREGIS